MTLAKMNDFSKFAIMIKYNNYFLVNFTAHAHAIFALKVLICIILMKINDFHKFVKIAFIDILIY